MFIVKAITFSVIFFYIGFYLYIYSINDMSKGENTAVASVQQENILEYNRQIKESAKTIEKQKALMIRADIDMAEQEQNIKRMAAILDLWEKQLKRNETTNKAH